MGVCEFVWTVRVERTRLIQRARFSMERPRAEAVSGWESGVARFLSASHVN